MLKNDENDFSYVEHKQTHLRNTYLLYTRHLKNLFFLSILFDLWSKTKYGSICYPKGVLPE